MRTESDFHSDDRNHWIELARTYKVRLPYWSRPCTTGGMRRFLRKINVSVEDYIARTNSVRLRDFIDMNPDWPLRAWVGLELEWLEMRDKPPVEFIEYRKPRKTTRKPKTVGDLVESTGS